MRLPLPPIHDACLAFSPHLLPLLGGFRRRQEVLQHPQLVIGPALRECHALAARVHNESPGRLGEEWSFSPGPPAAGNRQSSLPCLRFLPTRTCFPSGVHVGTECQGNRLPERATTPVLCRTEYPGCPAHMIWSVCHSGNRQTGFRRARSSCRGCGCRGGRLSPRRWPGLCAG